MTTPTTPKPDDGGPAFPPTYGNEYDEYPPGLSKREYYAAHVTDAEITECIEALRLWQDRVRFAELYPGAPNLDPMEVVTVSCAKIRLMIADALIERLKR